MRSTTLSSLDRIRSKLFADRRSSDAVLDRFQDVYPHHKLDATVIQADYDISPSSRLSGYPTLVTPNPWPTISAQKEDKPITVHTITGDSHVRAVSLTKRRRSSPQLLGRLLIAFQLCFNGFAETCLEKGVMVEYI